MIVTECPYNNDKSLVKTSSDEGFYIVQNETGRKYSVAVDAYPCKYTYSETSEKAPPRKNYGEYKRILAEKEKANQPI